MPSLSKKFYVLVLAISVALAGNAAFGKTGNGNEYALYLTEAKTGAEQRALIADALGKQHFFRYLKIMTMQEGQTNGFPFVFLAMKEPSSQLTVWCTVMKSLSLQKLQEDPPTKVGDCVAITGVVAITDMNKKLIILNPVIVRYKDLPAPQAGKELLATRDTSSVIYSFTGGKNPVNVTERDRDLVAHEKEMLEKLGKDGWSKYLLAEIAKRDKAAAEQRNKMNIFRKNATPEPGSSTNAPSPVTKDDD